MKKFKNRKLPQLNSETVSQLSITEMKSVKGGFLTIGHKCCYRLKCGRLWTKSWGDDPPGDCENEDVINAF